MCPSVVGVNGTEVVDHALFAPEIIDGELFVLEVVVTIVTAQPDYLTHC